MLNAVRETHPRIGRILIDEIGRVVGVLFRVPPMTLTVPVSVGAKCGAFFGSFIDPHRIKMLAGNAAMRE